jgi:hypothetical protein
VQALGGYFDVIKRPMCLQTVCERLYTGQYTSARQLIADVVLVFDNALAFAAESGTLETDLIPKVCSEVFGGFGELHSFCNPW